MLKLARSIFIFFILSIGIPMTGKETKSPEYLKYVRDIVDDFGHEIEKKYGLYYCGYGGSMPFNVKEIDVSFTCRRKVTIEEARQIGVDTVQQLLQRINTHAKIRPFLNEYPFTPNEVSIAFSIELNGKGWPLDGSLAYFFLARNKIFYSKVEIVNYPKTPLYYMNKKNEVVKKMIGGGPKEELVNLYEESFDDALKILGLPH